MIDFLLQNPYLFLVITLGAFAFGRWLQSKFHSPILNPILIATVIVIIFLVVTGISVDDYQAGCAPFQYLLTPATICFAVSMYEQVQQLKKHLLAILIGVLSGSVASVGSIRLMCLLFGLDKTMVVSLLPKSITTAIGMILSEEAGGIASVTVAAIILTGILGNILAPVLCKWLKLDHPISQGVAIGTSSHAIGTSKANEMGSLCGAVSSLSLTFAGLVTVVLFSFFA